MGNDQSSSYSYQSQKESKHSKNQIPNNQPKDKKSASDISDSNDSDNQKIQQLQYKYKQSIEAIKNNKTDNFNNNQMSLLAQMWKQDQETKQNQIQISPKQDIDLQQNFIVADKIEIDNKNSEIKDYSSGQKLQSFYKYDHQSNQNHLPVIESLSEINQQGDLEQNQIVEFERKQQENDKSNVMIKKIKKLDVSMINKNANNIFVSAQKIADISINKSLPQIMAKETEVYFSNEQKKYYASKFHNIDSNYVDEINLMQKKKRIRWKKGGFIGNGSFGQVNLGLNIENGTLMAVKQIHYKDDEGHNQKIQVIEQEIRLLSFLDHKNIVRYIGTSKDQNMFYIFLEYVSGGSLFSIIKQYGKLDERIIRIYTKQILEGIEYLHWNGIIHRDIKGANILVDNRGICKLTDFGSSKKLASILEKEVNKTIIGTANWMAPEVIQQVGYERKADIWSIGCVVIEMATGKPPYCEYDNPMSVMYFIAKNVQPPKIPDTLSNRLIEPSKRVNIYKLIRHPFITGDSQIPQQLNIDEEVSEVQEVILQKNIQEQI